MQVPSNKTRLPEGLSLARAEQKSRGPLTDEPLKLSGNRGMQVHFQRPICRFEAIFYLPPAYLLPDIDGPEIR